MKPRAASITRRHLLAAAGATALAAKASAVLRPAPLASGFAFTASHGELHTYAVHGSAWIPVQTLPSEAPVSLVADRLTHTLHLLHAVSEHRGLPRGYIESFRIDNRGGRLQPLSIQPLSLSAVRPNHMALSPDGKSLAVAVDGGAAYNLLPILKDGSPGRPIAIRKETGLSSTSPSRPGHIAFNSSGNRIFAFDRGTATLSIFSAQPDLPLLSRLALPIDGHRSHLAFHADTNTFFVLDAASRSLLTIEHNPQEDELTLHPHLLKEDFRGPIAIHAGTQTLFAVAAGSIRLFRMPADSRELRPIQEIPLPPSFNSAQTLLLDEENHLLYMTAESGIYRAEINTRYTDLASFTWVAPSAHAITLL